MQDELKINTNGEIAYFDLFHNFLQIKVNQKLTKVAKDLS